MKTLCCLSLLMLPVIIVTCSICSCCEQPSKEAIPVKLQASIDAFYASVESGDVEARIALFSDKAIVMPNHWTMYEGKEAIARMLRSGEGSVFKLRDRVMIDHEVSGDLAYTVNSYFYTWHTIDTEPQWHKTKNVHLWKKDTEGNWKLHVDIWNSDVPMSQFPNE